MPKQNVVLWVIILIALTGISLSFLVFYSWNRPLGPSLGLPTFTPDASQLVSVPPAGSPGGISAPEATLTAGSNNAVGGASPSPAPTSAPLCGGPRTMTILAIGSDQRDTGYLYGLADSIHVMRIDFRVPNLMVVDFPRDLWVEIPGIADHYGITHGKLNQAYFYGNPGMGYYDGPGEGPGLLARTLDANYGMRPDHYIAIDSHTFIRMIDALGGVDITITSPIELSNGTDEEGHAYYLAAGTHHLNGKMTYTLATNRIPSTFQRMKYQKMILSSLREKLLSPSILPKIPKLVSQFIGSVQTDLSPSDINSLICIAQAIPKGNIQADSFPQAMFTPESIYDSNRGVYTFVYTVDIEQLRAMVAEFMKGIWPMPAE